MAQPRRCADPRSRWSVATVKRKLSARQLLDIGHVIQRERRQPRPGMSTVPSIQGGAVRGPSPLVALGSDHVQELGRGGGHPRPAQPVGEHILEDPAWVAKPPGHPARRPDRPAAGCRQRVLGRLAWRSADRCGTDGPPSSGGRRGAPRPAPSTKTDDERGPPSGFDAASSDGALVTRPAQSWRNTWPEARVVTAGKPAAFPQRTHHLPIAALTADPQCPRRRDSGDRLQHLPVRHWCNPDLRRGRSTPPGSTSTRWGSS